MTATADSTTPLDTPLNAPTGKPPRITSVDATRGLVMFTMIYVNDFPEDVGSWWMHHAPGNADWMTFVDMVFPGFLFLVGMSIPIALGSRIRKGEPIWKTLSHVLIRTISLLAIGIMMVNSEGGGPNAKVMGWAAADASKAVASYRSALWIFLMFMSSILAFCTISPRKNAGEAARRIFRATTIALRIAGIAGMLWLAVVFRGRRGSHIITFSPFEIRHSWYGILGLLGWAYLVGSIVFLMFRRHRTALLGSCTLLMCLFAADRGGVFETFKDWWFFRHRIVGVGDTLGSLPSITVAGVLLASIFFTPDTVTAWARTRFTLLFIAGFSIAALLLHGEFTISKNGATPPWCFWACAITAAVWLIFYLIGDVLRWTWATKPFAIAGQNVLLAYLISEMMESALHLVRLDDWYDHLSQGGWSHAVMRSMGCAVFVLCVSTMLNALGFRLKL